jgi:hypothetical protein
MSRLKISLLWLRLVKSTDTFKERLQKEATRMTEMKKNPGVCFPWEEKKKEYLEIKGDEEIVRKWWEHYDTQAYIHLWFCVIGL